MLMMSLSGAVSANQDEGIPPVGGGHRQGPVLQPRLPQDRGFPVSMLSKKFISTGGALSIAPSGDL